jgi:ABC-type transport system involved in cytochrome c biogenesis ATPase subunit
MLAGKRLRQMTASLEPGLHVLWASDPIGSDELIPLLDGSTAPRRGNVRLDERYPYRDPEVRKHIGSLWSEESLPHAPTLRQSLQALALEPKSLDAALGWLERFGKAELFGQPSNKLDSQQTRLVALAIALSKPALALLLLHEPLAATNAAGGGLVVQQLTQLALSIPVLVVTASRNTASRLGGPTAELGGGFWRRLPERAVGSYTLRISGASLRPLAAEIVRRPRVRSLRLTTRTEGHDELWLETSDPSSVSVDLVRLAQQLGLALWSFETVVGAP